VSSVGVLSLESLVPQYFGAKPATITPRPKSEEPLSSTSLGNETKKYERYSPNKAGSFQVESIVPQYFTKRN
jgi:hypothetical protein